MTGATRKDPVHHVRAPPVDCRPEVGQDKGTRPGGRTVFYIIRNKFVVEIQGTDAVEEEIARTQ